MKSQIPIPHRVCALLAGASMSITSSQAALTAYDGFGHPASSSLSPYAAPSPGSAVPTNTLGTVLNGLPQATNVNNTGLGFTGKWSEALPTGDIGTFTTRFVRYGSDPSWVLNYPGLRSNNAAGALIYGSGFSYGQINRARRLLANPITSATTGTQYISFLMRKNSANPGYIGFEMLNGGAENSNRTLQFGGSTDTSDETGNWGLRLNNTVPIDNTAIGTAVQSDVPVVANETVLVVMKLVLSASAASDSVTLWVNPTSLAFEAGSGPGVSLSGVDFTADSIALAGYTFSGHWCFFDEFRIGTAWGDVLPGPSLETALPVGVPNQYAFGGVGQPFSYKLFASNRPTNFTIAGTLPNGLVLNAANGTITGTPTAVGVSNLSFTSTNSVGTSSAVSFSIETVASLNRRELIGGSLTTLGNRATESSPPFNSSFATNFAYDGNTSTNHASASVYNNRLVVDLGAANPKFLTGFRFFPRPNATNRAFGGEVQTSVDGVNFTTVGKIDFEPVANAWNTVQITSTARGRYFRYYNPGFSDVSEIEFRAHSLVPISPVITPNFATRITVSELSKFTVTAVNEPTIWTDVSSNTGNNRIPAGLLLDAATGEISGSTTEVGTFTPSLTAANGDGVSPAVTITLTVAPSELIIYEGFNYTEAALAFEPDPVGAPGVYVALNGGTGFIEAWQTFSQEPLSSPGLSKGNLIVAGKKVLQGNNGNYRSFATQTPTGIYWFNVLMTLEDFDNSVGGDLAFTLNIQDVTDNSFMSIGYSFDQYKIAGSSVPQILTPAALPNGSVNMFTVRLDMFTNVMHVWVNATPGAVAPDDSTAVVPGGTQFAPFKFSRIQFGGFGPAAAKAMDEIRIGKTFAQVAPAATSGTALQTFRSANGLAALGTQDLETPANDGVSNLLKFAFNMIGAGPGKTATLLAPNVTPFNGTAGLPIVSRQAVTGRLQVTYPRRITASNSGVTYAVEFSTDLGITDPWAVNAAASEAVTSIDSVFEQVIVTDTSAVPRRFARVRVIAN